VTAATRKLVCRDSEQTCIVFERVFRQEPHLVAVFQPLFTTPKRKPADHRTVILRQGSLHGEVISVEIYLGVTHESGVCLSCLRQIIADDVPRIVLPERDDEVIGLSVVYRGYIACVAPLALAQRETREIAWGKRAHNLLTGKKLAALIASLEI